MYDWFETFGEQKLDSAHALAVIKECDHQINQSFLSAFLQLGTTSTGSRSVGEVHHLVHRRSALNLCDKLASVISGIDRRGGGTIGRLAEWNYGKVSPSQLPRLVHSGLDSDDLTESLASLGPLVQSGLVTPENELERSIRQRIGAGDLPDEASRSHIERSMTGFSGGGAAALAEQYRKIKRGVR